MKKGTKHTDDTRTKMKASQNNNIATRKGLTLEQRYGKEKADEMKANMRAARLGKTWEQLHGKEKAEQMRVRQQDEEIRV